MLYYVSPQGLEPDNPSKFVAKKRRCLSCHDEFLSDWIGNRLCTPCKDRGYSPEWKRLK